MEPGSEYTIPIFISSPVYNLIDLRAELARYLRDIGYRPILSSENGFPHEDPRLSPWESCLPALERCYVVVLIIDGRYGQRLAWDNYSELGNEPISPTHAEYRYAHSIRKRLLVFVRRDIETHYQSFRQAFRAEKDANGKEDGAARMAALAKVLPEHLEVDALSFFREVKTTKPIPWIRPFDDVTQIKTEIQKQLINELAKLFMLREQRWGDVVHKMAQSLDVLSPKEREKVLQTMGGGDLVTLIENRTEEITRLRKQTEEQSQQLLKLKGEQEQEHRAEIEALTSRIRERETKIRWLESDRTSAIMDTGSIEASGTTLNWGSFGSTLGTTYFGTAEPFVRTTNTFGWNLQQPETCTECQAAGSLRKCATCARNLCLTCWDKPGNAAKQPKSERPRGPYEIQCRMCSGYASVPR